MLVYSMGLLRQTGECILLVFRTGMPAIETVYVLSPSS